LCTADSFVGYSKDALQEQVWQEESRKIWQCKYFRITESREEDPIAYQEELQGVPI
jgi:hypothetical protein